MKSEHPRASRSWSCSAVAAASLFAFLAASSGSLPAAAKSEAVEVLKYFNPLPEKKYSLNESQDRLIKKRTFKRAELPAERPALNKEIGLFAVVDPHAKADQLNELLSRPEVNGLSAVVTWRQLEPEEGEYNWQPIDELLDLVGKHDKSLILRIATCGVDLPYPETPTQSDSVLSDTPDWVFAGGVKSVTYTGADGKKRRMPVFWDSTYLANWSNLVRELGKRYDKHPGVHSIGITGGGIAAGTAVLPEPASLDSKEAPGLLRKTLKTEHGMSQRQLVEHWKYVADIFPKSFPNARLNFDIDPPTPDRSGQDALDEIADYLVYRYGQRIYLTRQNVADDKHGFDQYRLLLKFHPDTLTGLRLSEKFATAKLEKLTQLALNDGISFAEIPVALLNSPEPPVKAALKELADHIGYQVATQKVTLPEEVPAGQPIKAGFTFTNFGAAPPMRPFRAFEKDVAASYRIQVELRDTSGKPVVISYHTPDPSTTTWKSGQPVSWQEDLKMPPLPAGDYTVFLSLVDSDNKRKLRLLDNLSGKGASVEDTIAVGKIRVVTGGGATVGSVGRTQ